MQVFVVFYGYEDMEGVFSTEENAKRYIRAQLATHDYLRKDNYSILEEIIDKPKTD